MLVFVLVATTFTTSTPSATLSAPQLVFVATASAILWALFVFVQTVLDALERIAVY
jgi:hypothetical protein